jgi:hypothetical protein
MQSLRATADVVRRIGLLALLGVAVVVLSGPVLALLSVVLSVATVVLSFALVGFAAWSAFQFALHGKDAAWDNIRVMGQNLGRHTLTVGQALLRGLAFLPRLLGRVVVGIGWLAWMALRFVWATVRFVLEVALLAIFGAAVGAVVGAVGMANPETGLTVPVSALAGAIIAALVGAVMALLTRRGGRSQTPEEPSRRIHVRLHNPGYNCAWGHGEGKAPARHAEPPEVIGVARGNG